ncbi:MAG: hypothetical protein GYA65_14325, partial [Actinobacteria bacterium]|nr:hypothetical protein [Actinomycetota bacterium]
PGGSGVTAIVRLPKAILEVVGAPGTSAPVVDVPAMAQVLSEPLPLTVSVAAAPMMMEQAPSDMSDEALWEAMKAPAAAVAPVALAPDGVTTGVVPAIEPLGTPSLTTQSGLTKRVRGAQMPELGSTQTEDTPARPAEEVRNTLASLQRGVELGRQQRGDS